MNKHFYRVIFNHALGLWQCVSELAKTAGKSKSLKAIAITGVMLISADAISADVEYADGKTHSFTDNVSLEGDVLISNPNTKLTSTGQIIFAHAMNTNINITNQASVESQKDLVLAVTANATVAVDNATLESKDGSLVLGFTPEKTATLLGKNEAKIKIGGIVSIANVENSTANFELTGNNTNLTVNNINKPEDSVINVGEATGANGTLTLNDNASIHSKQVIVGRNTNSHGTLNSDSSTINTDDLFIGAYGNGKANLNKNVIKLNKYYSLADNTGSTAEVISTNNTIYALSMDVGSIGTANLQSANDTYHITNNIEFGQASGSKGVAHFADSDIHATNMTIGLSTGSQGEVTLAGDNSKLYLSKDLVVGAGGTGVLTLDKNSMYGTGLTAVNNNVYIGGSSDSDENKQNGTGTLTLRDSALRAKEFIVGHTGKGILRLEGNNNDDYTTALLVHQISRNPNSKQSDIYINNAEIRIEENQPNLFANFTKDNKIELGRNGVLIETEKTKAFGEVEATQVVINPNAVITGDAGTFNIRRDNGGFAKTGKGTLEISENSKQFTGDIGAVQGLLKINGNYTMNGENLVIGIIDFDNDNTLDTTSEYGKLEVTGTADISKGSLKVIADNIAKALITGTSPTGEFKDIIKAGILTGRFKDVQVLDNYGNPITTSLTADYTDEKDGRVHLGFKPQNPTTNNPSLPSSVTTFTDAVKSQNNTSAENIATVLDKAVATSGNLLGETLKFSSSTLNQAQLSDYTNQLQPLMLGTTGQLFNQNQAIFAQAVQEQTLSPSRHLWAKAIYKDGKLKSSTAVNGLDDRHYGAIIGADTAITPKLNLGVALAYVDSQAKTHGIQQKMTSDHIQGLIYGNYQAGANTLLNFHAGIGQVDIHGERHINVPHLDTLTTAKSDYKADTTQAGIGVQHRIGSEKQYLEPFAQFDYRQVRSKAYQETGSNMFNLNVDKQRHQALRWTAGMRANQPLTTNLALTGFVSASIEQADNPTVYATFNQFSGEKFATTGQKLGQEIGSAGLGLRFYPTAMTEVSGLYQGEWRKHYQNHAGLLEFKMKF